MNDLEKARDFFKDDVFATDTTGIVIEEVGDRYAKCSLKLNSSHMNAANQVMGGAIFTLADFTFAVAANHSRERLTVTTVSQISYLSTAKGDVLYGESKMIKDGKRSCFYEISITDNTGNLVALVSTNGAHIK